MPTINPSDRTNNPSHSLLHTNAAYKNEANVFTEHQTINDGLQLRSGAQPVAPSLHSDGTNLYVASTNTIYLRPTGAGSNNGTLALSNGASGAALTFYGPAAEADVNLYRGGADTLKTDDSLQVTGDLQVTGNSQVTGALTANSSILASSYIEGTEITAPGTPPANRGRLYVRDDDGFANLFYKNDAGVEGLVRAGEIVVRSTDFSVINTTAVTLIDSITVPANSLRVGSAFRITASGNMDQATTTATTYTFEVRIGGVSGNTVASIAVTGPASSKTGVDWFLQADVSVRAIGSSGSMRGGMRLDEALSATAVTTRLDTDRAAAAVNTTIANDLALVCFMATASAAYVIRVFNVVMERIRF